MRPELPMSAEVTAFLARPRPPTVDESRHPSHGPERRTWRSDRDELARRLYATGEWSAIEISEALGLTKTWWGGRMRALGIEPHAHLRGRNFRVKPPAPPLRIALDAAAQHVARNPGCSSADIARMLHVTRQRVHQIVARLVADGLVRAEKRPGHPSRMFPPDA